MPSLSRLFLFLFLFRMKSMFLRIRNSFITSTRSRTNVPVSQNQQPTTDAKSLEITPLAPVHIYDPQLKAFPVIPIYVPQELVAHIFEHACFEKDFVTILGITQVSRLWRRVAFSTPTIWSTLSMSFASEEVPCHHADMVASWLSRSGDLDLHIVFHGFCTNPEIIEPIVRFSHRVSSLELQTPLASLLPLAALPGDSTFSRLRNFTSLTWGHPYDSESDLVDEEDALGLSFMERTFMIDQLLQCSDRRSLFLMAPNLTSVSIHHRSHLGDPFHLSGFMNLAAFGMRTEWGFVTHLVLKETHLDIEVLHNVLFHCPRLVFLDACVTGNYVTPPPLIVIQQVMEPVHVMTLHHLEHLQLSISLWDQSDSIGRQNCNFLFLSLRLPSLFEIHLHRVESPLHGLERLDSGFRLLKKLSLIDCQLGDSSRDLSHFLRSCVFLEEIQLEEASTEPAWWLDLALIQDLTVEPGSSMLPSLHKLVIKVQLPPYRVHGQPKWLLHSCILKMVASRWKPGPTGEEDVRQWSSVWLWFPHEPGEYLTNLEEGYEDLVKTGLDISLQYGRKVFTSNLEFYHELLDRE
ncbi:hypothetical protein K435DRAFT_804728 [Dendrothele bispora CBS 962.96]|uniref:Uncharacterized protein n=1 Tax=Dendrothele bispora (strain CBS 962.96) TaxID=1314807 RepID=A0A4S8LDB1_DENBC|nr:hypothetical protein K435DRAFT_804728 [Dendrothele bispora CBS 962.96]